MCVQSDNVFLSCPQHLVPPSTFAGSFWQRLAPLGDAVTAWRWSRAQRTCFLSVNPPALSFFFSTSFSLFFSPPYLKNSPKWVLGPIFLHFQQDPVLPVFPGAGLLVSLSDPSRLLFGFHLFPSRQPAWCVSNLDAQNLFGEVFGLFQFLTPFYFKMISSL